MKDELRDALKVISKRNHCPVGILYGEDGIWDLAIGSRLYPFAASDILEVVKMFAHDENCEKYFGFVRHEVSC